MSLRSIHFPSLQKLPMIYPSLYEENMVQGGALRQIQSQLEIIDQRVGRQERWGPRFKVDRQGKDEKNQNIGEWVGQGPFVCPLCLFRDSHSPTGKGAVGMSVPKLRPQQYSLRTWAKCLEEWDSQHRAGVSEEDLPPPGSTETAEAAESFPSTCTEASPSLRCPGRQGAGKVYVSTLARPSGKWWLRKGGFFFNNL